MSAEPVVKIAGSPMRMPNTPFTPKRDVKPASQEVPASAEPTSRNENDKLCSQCKTATVMPPATRCKPCHALYNRVYEAKKLMDEGSIEVWNKLDRDKKAEFINASKALTVDDLKAKLQVFVSKETEAKQSLSLRSTANFLDSPDLADKYNNKPKQLESIREKARKVHCPTRECILYEDPSYESNSTATETITEKRKMNFSSEEIIPQAKKPKVKKITAGEETDKLKEGQQSKLEQWMGYLAKLQEELDKHEGEIGDLVKFMPPVAFDALKEAKELVKQKQEVCETIKEEGKCDDWCGLAKGMSEFKKQLGPKKIALDTQVKAAKTASGEKPNKKKR